MQQRNRMNDIEVGREISITNIGNSKALATYISDVARIEYDTSAEREAELFDEYQRTKSKDIASSIVKNNLRFVISVAKIYAKVTKIPLEDLIQEGNIGLMNAIDSFNPTYGFRFISWAVWFIRKQIMESINENGAIVNIPFGKRQMATKIRSIISDFEQKEYRTPTTEELAEILGITTEEVVTCMMLSSDSVSLSAPVATGDEDRYTIADTIVSDTFKETDNRASNSMIHAALERVFKSLTWKEEYIIRCVFGFETTELTEDEISETLHMTKERVRQLKFSAIEKIKNNPNAKELAQYIIKI